MSQQEFPTLPVEQAKTALHTIQSAGSAGLQRLKDIDQDEKSKAFGSIGTVVLVLLALLVQYLTIKRAVASALREYRAAVEADQQSRYERSAGKTDAEKEATHDSTDNNTDD